MRTLGAVIATPEIGHTLESRIYVRLRPIADVHAVSHDPRVSLAIKIIGTFSAVLWASLLVLVMVLGARSAQGLSSAELPYMAVAFVAFASALWIAFPQTAKPTMIKLILSLIAGMLLFVAGLFCWLIVAAASG